MPTFDQPFGDLPGHGGPPEPAPSQAAQKPPCADAHEVFCPEAWAGVAIELKLSAGQLDIVRRVMADQSDKQIATALGRSRHTIQTHMARLRKKLGVHSRGAVASHVMVAYHAWRRKSPPPQGCQYKS